MEPPFRKPEGCLQTEIVAADGTKVVLFHMRPMRSEDKAFLEGLSGHDLQALVTATCAKFWIFLQDEDESKCEAIRVTEPRFG